MVLFSCRWISLHTLLNNYSSAYVHCITQLSVPRINTFHMHCTLFKLAEKHLSASHRDNSHSFGQLTVISSYVWAALRRISACRKCRETNLENEHVECHTKTAGS